MTAASGKRRAAKKPAAGATRQAEKLQRWLDLLAALLVRQFPAPFEDLARDVPGYDRALGQGASLESVKRMFERDKDELRAFGVPIESHKDDEGNLSLYRLRHRDFYLPYLSLAAAHQRPKRGARYGLRSLPEIAFEPDELAAITSAAARAQQLGDPSLAAAAASARRKLGMDLDIEAGLPDDEVRELVPARQGHEAEVFEAVSDAVARRKELSFRYRSMERDETSPRRVQPWGLFYLGSAWYLVAHDLDREALRNFRLSRMTEARVSTARPNSAEFEVPEGFDLRKHAQSAESWELGDSDAMEVVVRFTGTSGYVEAARRLGAPLSSRGAEPPNVIPRSDSDEGSTHRTRWPVTSTPKMDPSSPTAPRDDTGGDRVFRVRRREVFARWLLTFAGDAVPVSPPDFVEQFRGLVRETLALYERP